MSRWRGLWHLLNLPCEGMTRLASESLDRDLTRLERFALESHLLYCVACRRYARQLQVVRRALARLVSRLQTDDPLSGPGLPDVAREKIKQTLKRE
jgi:predicted anti-sigma-YlaC factor YlaD